VGWIVSSQSGELLPEKAVIVAATVDARLLVTAGPGTGKTYAVVRRIEKLVSDYGLGPGSEILLMSFSRAAVQELRTRVKGFQNAAYVKAVTFDSFATRFLYEADPNIDLSVFQYDDRIKAVATMLRDVAAAREQLGHVRHVLVDELQDLVGVRAELMLEVLKACAGGFTLFGDPAQGIYDFQLENQYLRERGALYVYDTLRQEFGSALKEYRLEENYRVQTAVAGTALWAGPELASRNPDYKRIKTRLQGCLQRLDTLGDVKATAYSLNPYQGTTGILCRTNGQAMAVSRELWNADISHVLRRRATDRVIPAWVGAVLGNARSQMITRSEFFEVWDRRKVLLTKRCQLDLDCEGAWEILRRATKGNGRQLDVTSFAAKLRTGNLPDELNEVPSSNVIVSTIHRAKGLEFDRVFVSVDSSEDLGRAPDEDAYVSEGEEARVLFVALTRPKKEMFHMKPIFARELKKQGAGSRWLVKGFQFWMFRSFELRGDDFVKDEPAGVFGFKANVIDLQNYLAEDVRPGDPVSLFKHIVNGAEHYVIDHRGRMIGVTSEAFGWDLFHTLKVKHDWKVKWPEEIAGLRIESVDTVVGSGTVGVENGLGASNLWLRARVSGLGDLKF
jgi:hypothetical protein